MVSIPQISGSWADPETLFASTRKHGQGSSAWSCDNDFGEKQLESSSPHLGIDFVLASESWGHASVAFAATAVQIFDKSHLFGKTKHLNWTIEGGCWIFL